MDTQTGNRLDIKIFWLQMYLEQGCTIKYQNDKWWLFAQDGNGIQSGESLYDLIQN